MECLNPEINRLISFTDEYLAILSALYGNYDGNLILSDVHNIGEGHHYI